MCLRWVFRFRWVKVLPQGLPRWQHQQLGPRAPPAARCSKKKVEGGRRRRPRRRKSPPVTFSESTLRGARGPGLARSEIPIFSEMKRASGAYDHIPAFRLALRITRDMDPSCPRLFSHGRQRDSPDQNDPRPRPLQIRILTKKCRGSGAVLHGSLTKNVPGPPTRMMQGPDQFKTES